MEITDPSLGMFSLLPAEVRIMIWKHFSPKLHVGRSLPRKPNRLLRDQEILLTSRKIYAEVAAEVLSGYNDDTIIISVQPDYAHKPWIRARNTEGVQWDLEGIPDAISRGFGDLPWHNLKVRIWIWAPCKEVTAQLINLYQKVHALTEMLRGVKEFLSLWVVFRFTENTSWSDDEKPQCSIKNISDSWTVASSVHWDYEFIFPLFLQIRNVKEARMFSTETVGGKRENLKMVEMFMQAQKVMRKKTPYGSGADWYCGTQIGVHLDFLFLKVKVIIGVL